MGVGRAVPYATDSEGRVIAPKEAVPGGQYTCLECHESVSFRRAHTRLGRDVEAHFAHRPGNECAGESVLHLAAKFRLREALEQQERPFVLHQVCARWHCSNTWNEPLTLPEFDMAAEEIAFEAYRLDVAALLGSEVVMGFEVFHSHRIGSVKAAALNLPWVELQAGPTADDPYLLQPVVQESLVGDEAWSLRYRFAERQDDLPAAVEAWITRSPTLNSTPRGLQLSANEIAAVFNARQQQTNLHSDSLCPHCQQAKQAFEKLLLEQRELERKAEEREFERQRGIFGPGLRRPFSRYDVQEMTEKAITLRFALRYMPYPQRLIAYFREHPYERLIARRCAKCQKPILCVDSRDYLADYKVYYPMIEFFKPDPKQRGYFIPKCLHCGTRQKLSSLWMGRCVFLKGEEFVMWVDAFRE